MKEAMRIYSSVSLTVKHDRMGPHTPARMIHASWNNSKDVTLVVNRHARIFGERPDEFRPKLWLRGEDESDEFGKRLGTMRCGEFAFRHAKRIYTEKYVALVEMVNVVGIAFNIYNLRVADLSKEWKVGNRWFLS